MRLLDELYDLKSDEPVMITLEKLLDAEHELDRKINALGAKDNPENLSSYLRRKQMLADLKFEFDSIR